MDLVSCPVVEVGHADDARPCTEEPCGQGMGCHRQIRPVHRGSEEGGGRAATSSVLLGDLVVAEAFLHRPIEVVMPWKPPFDTGVHKGTGQGVGVALVGHVEGTP